MCFLESTSLYETLKEIKNDSAVKLKAQLLLMQDRAQRSAQMEQELLKEIER